MGQDEEMSLRKMTNLTLIWVKLLRLSSTKDEIEIDPLCLVNRAYYGLFGPWEDDSLDKKLKLISLISFKDDVEANSSNLRIVLASCYKYLD